MTPADEASAILIRMFETMAASMGKRLKEAHKAEIRRACELLSADGALESLDDLPRVSPAEAMIPASAAIPKDWLERKRREERER